MTGRRTARAAQRRDQVLEAARGLFLLRGLRGTSMEAIAREAGIAKATLYAQFPDKTAIVEGLLEQITVAKRTAAAAALDGRGSGVERAANALAAKYKLLARMLEGSPHAEELEAEGRRLSAHATAGFDDWFAGRIAEALAEDGVANPQQSAQLLIACADGIAGHATRAEEIGPAIRLVANRLFAQL